MKKRRSEREAAGAACAHAGARREPTSPLELERAAGLLRAMADPARLRLLDLLAQGERCVSELARDTDEALSATSQRLRTLRGEALVIRRRDGKHIHYALADRHVADLVRSVLEHARETAPPRRQGDDE